MTIAAGHGFTTLLGAAAVRRRAMTATRSMAGAAQARVPSWTLLATALLPTLLTTGWLVAGALEPAPYDPVRQTVSVLAGQGAAHRWIVTSTLYVVGLIYLIIAAAFRALEPLSRAGLLVSGATAISVASFPEPAHGTSTMHVLCTGIGAIALAVWPAIVARRRSPLRAALGTPIAFTAATISLLLLVWTAIETRNGSALGLAERVSSSLQTAWPFAVAVGLRHAQQQHEPQHNAVRD